MAAAETLFAYSSLFIVLLQICVANAKPNCTPSACGIIPNITHPFRLKGDPGYCGDGRHELACENNVTLILYLKSHKYYVKAINYTSNTITLVDASINTNDACSFPTSSAYLYNFTTSAVRVSDHPYYRLPRSTSYPYDYLPSHINIMSCPHPLKDSSNFTNITHCQSKTSRFSYVKVGHLNASEVKHMCRVDLIVMTSWGFGDLNNNAVSLEEIHRSLLYGFELEFLYGTPLTAWEKFTIFFHTRLSTPFLILLAIAAVTGALVNPVIAVIVVSGILLYISINLYYAIQYNYPLHLLEYIYSFVANAYSAVKYKQLNPDESG